MRNADKFRLFDLLTRVREVHEPNTSLNNNIWTALRLAEVVTLTLPKGNLDITGSASSALALFAAALPDWWPMLRQNGPYGHWVCWAARRDLKAGLSSEPCATPALAITGAILAALVHIAGEPKR